MQSIAGPTRGVWSRCFGPVRLGSLRVAILSLIATALGSGLLALPYLFYQCGIILGSFLLFIGGYISYVSFIILSKAGSLTQISNYNGLVDAYFGRRWSRSLEINITIFCTGGIVGYLIFMGSFVPQLINQFASDTAAADVIISVNHTLNSVFNISQNKIYLNDLTQQNITNNLYKKKMIFNNFEEEKPNDKHFLYTGKIGSKSIFSQSITNYHLQDINSKKLNKKNQITNNKYSKLFSIKNKEWPVAKPKISSKIINILNDIINDEYNNDKSLSLKDYKYDNITNINSNELKINSESPLNNTEYFPDTKINNIKKSNSSVTKSVYFDSNIKSDKMENNLVDNENITNESHKSKIEDLQIERHLSTNELITETNNIYSNPNTEKKSLPLKYEYILIKSIPHEKQEIISAQISKKNNKSYNKNDKDLILSRTNFLILHTIFILLPLSLQHDMYKLRHFTTLSIISIMFLVLVIFIRAIRIQNLDYGFVWYLLPHSQWRNWITAVTICTFTYCCHMNLFDALSSLDSPSPDRIKKVFKRATGFEIALYMILGLSGFLLYGVKTPDNILVAFIGSTNIISQLASLGIFFSLSASIALNIFPTRSYIRLFVERAMGVNDEQILDIDFFEIEEHPGNKSSIYSEYCYNEESNIDFVSDKQTGNSDPNSKFSSANEYQEPSKFISGIKEMSYLDDFKYPGLRDSASESDDSVLHDMTVVRNGPKAPLFSLPEGVEQSSDMFNTLDKLSEVAKYATINNSDSFLNFAFDSDSYRSTEEILSTPSGAASPLTVKRTAIINPTTDNFLHISITIIILFLSLVAAIYITDITALLAFLGGSCASVFVFLIPLMIGLKDRRIELSSYDALLLGFCFLIGIFGALMQIPNLIPINVFYH